MIDLNLLKILCCPETRQSLQLAEDQVVAGWNEKISKEGVVNRAGTLIKEEIEALLIREDGQFAYPVRNGIPVMLVDEAISLA
jgi:uncharacterized protein YbaR (Trm112 family)